MKPVGCKFGIVRIQIAQVIVNCEAFSFLCLAFPLVSDQSENQSGSGQTAQSSAASVLASILHDILVCLKKIN